MLEDSGLIAKEPDAFRDNRTTFSITEPLLTFYHAVMRPIWSDLEHAQDAARLWERSRRRFVGNVLGPHFEHVCRYWTRHFAHEQLLGDFAHRVQRGTVNDPERKTSHELDVVVYGLDDAGRQPILAIGEAKWGETMGTGHLDRLRHIRSLLTTQRRPGAESARLTCYSAAGFTDELRAEADADPAVILVDAAALYR